MHHALSANVLHTCLSVTDSEKSGCATPEQFEQEQLQSEVVSTSAARVLKTERSRPEMRK